MRNDDLLSGLFSVAGEAEYITSLATALFSVSAAEVTATDAQNFANLQARFALIVDKMNELSLTANDVFADVGGVPAPEPAFTSPVTPFDDGFELLTNESSSSLEGHGYKSRGGFNVFDDALTYIDRANLRPYAVIVYEFGEYVVYIRGSQ